MTAPLFVLAPPRSFTSITCAMLGNHPEMHGLAETNLFCTDTVAQLRMIHRKQPRLGHGLLRSMAQLAMGEQTRESVAAVDTWLQRNRDVSTGDIFAMLIRWSEDRVLVEKSPAHVYLDGALDRMIAAFPDARFLHLTRHPSDTWRSIQETREKMIAGLKRLKQFDDDEDDPKSGDGTIGQNADLEVAWLYPHLSIIDFLDGIPPAQHMRMKGEDFLSDPDTALPLLCDWLNISDDSEAIERMKHPEESPYACYGPTNARFGNDPNFMENAALRPYKPKIRPLEQAMEEGQDIGFTEDVFDAARAMGY